MSMTDLNYDDAPFAIRDDLTMAHRVVWERLSSPGTWLTADTRVAIITEVRNANGCALCRQRKEALSPYSVDGDHDSLGDLPENIVEVIHRVVSDPARLMKKWYDDCLASGLTEEEYVEIIGVVCSTVSIDTFARATGLPLRELPSPQPGEPTRIRPHNAKPGGAWVPWIGRDDAEGDDIPRFGPPGSNIRRSLSLVPAEAHGFMEMNEAQYLTGVQMRDFWTDYRAISRMQIELVAGRVSAINQCAY
jgi:alkylhydroperoxidase family enzyme